jgi:hypothetical protein
MYSLLKSITDTKIPMLGDVTFQLCLNWYSKYSNIIANACHSFATNDQGKNGIEIWKKKRIDNNQ